MSTDELNQLLHLTSAFGAGGLVAVVATIFLVRTYIPSYLAKKAENLATREDIAAITREIESVRTEYSILVEQLKAKHQLRMAALDRRLQVHQDAFELWRELYGAMHTDQIGNVVRKCQTWWEKNCLYLEPNVREAFVSAYSSAHLHSSLLNARADSKDIKENWEKILNFPNTQYLKQSNFHA